MIQPVGDEIEAAEELAASEAGYANWQPRAIAPDAYYRRFAAPLEAGGNNHRWPQVRAQFDELLACDGRILDCACGVGQLAIWLALAGKQVWAFDFSANAIRTARRSAELSGVADKVRFDVLDGRELSYEDGFFDIVTGRECLHHLIKYPRAIRELVRVLRPGGRGLFVEPLAFNPAVNVLRALSIRLAGAVGEHMLTRFDCELLRQEFGRMELRSPAVLSIFTRLLADSYSPIGPLRRRMCQSLIRLDQAAVSRWPSLTRWAGMAYLRLIKPYSTVQRRDTQIPV